MKVKATRTFVFDERMLKEQMRRRGYKDLETFIQKELKEDFAVNVLLEKLAVYQENITLEVEVIKDE